MTERMENALNHIKTSVDVDPWAVEEVERVFKTYEQTQDAIPTSVLKDAKAEIVKEMNSVSDPSVFHGYYRAWEIICNHITGVSNESKD